ncbi:hypothetical protein B1R94_27480 [Mycolicibacterium litorale]|nr:hypothetical protein B1R94_27480 [Mycolicibacterium litorale]
MGVIDSAVENAETPGDDEEPPGPGLPGWPWPWPPCEHPPGSGGPRGGVGLPLPGVGITPPDAAVGGGGHSGGGIGILPRTIPPPGEPGEPGEPGVVSADRGGVTPGGLEPAPITMPPLIGLPPMLEVPLRPAAPGGGTGSAAEPGPRSGAGRDSSATRERPPPTSSGAGTEVPPSTRVGYPEYLREAKTGEVAALALPGFAGLLALTALGGIFGYRQAKAGHVVRAAGTSRFLQ